MSARLVTPGTSCGRAGSEPGADGGLDQGHLLSGDGRLAAEILDQVASPPEERLSRRRSLVDGLESPDLHPGF